jgi:hypothetical protein
MTASQDPKQKSPALTLQRRVRRIVTLVALALAIAHLLFPDLAIDAITLGLLAVAVIPWLAPLVKSLELPGGWKVELQEMYQVSSRAQDAGLISADLGSPAPEHSFQLVADRDPNLALAGLRIEIERRLLRLAEQHQIPLRSRGIGSILRELDKRGVLTSEQRSVLADMVSLLNAAVHGADVDRRASEWAMEIGPGLLQSLDKLIEPRIFVQPDEPDGAKDGDLWIY